MRQLICEVNEYPDIIGLDLVDINGRNDGGFGSTEV